VRLVRPLAAAATLFGAALSTILTTKTIALTAVAAVANLVFALLVCLVAREAIRSTPSLWAAAAFGLTASASGHYYWSRPDSIHIVPLLALAATAVLFAWPVRLFERGIVFVTLVLPLLPLGGAADPELPAFSLGRGGLARAIENAGRSTASAGTGSRLATIWPAGEFSNPAAQAVFLADRLADPSSRFVAYGSDQAWTAGDPVFLFLLSARLPYTRWFQYDPGLQNTAPIQAEMLREIEASHSATAVVWRSEEYRYDPVPPGTPARSEFDARVEQIYPRVIGRFGAYEVRAR
jgi:hypothetical protein